MQVQHYRRMARGLFGVLGLSLCLGASQTAAAVTFTLSGTAEDSNNGPIANQETAGSVRVGVPMGDHLQFGVSHRRSEQTQREFVSATQTKTVNTRTSSNGVDLTVILYNGIVSPYVFGGYALRQIHFKTDTEEATFPAPSVTYGFGVAVQINQQFSLKINQTYIPGEKRVGVDADGKPVGTPTKDWYSEVGVTYKL